MCFTRDLETDPFAAKPAVTCGVLLKIFGTRLKNGSDFYIKVGHNVKSTVTSIHVTKHPAGMT